MKAVLALVLVALLVVCAQSKRAYFPGRNYNTLPSRPRWIFNKKALAAPADEEDDEESDFWMALAPLAVNLIKSKLSKKRDDFDEEADFINLKKVWGVAKNIGKSYLSSKYGINLDEEEESDSEFLSKLKNWWNSKGKDLAIKGLQIYSQIKNGGAQQGDEADEEEADLKLGNFFKKALNVAKNVGKSYLSSKYGINLDEEEESDFINWKKIGGIAKDIGKNYLSTKYGINLDEEEEESDFINWKKVWGTAKDIGKSYLSSKYGINLDEEDEEESDSMDAGSSAAAWAQQQVGKGYSQSARLGPNSYDCSGLIYVAYRNQGKTVPTSTHGYPGGLQRIHGEGNLRAGDILYRPGHVAMYVGGGQLVQAANPRKGVVRTSLKDYNAYWGGYTAIYRP